MNGKNKDTPAPTPQPTPKIVMERTYRAPVQELWDLWTTKEGLESWWAPEGIRTVVHSIEPRQNGSLHYEMIAESPEVLSALKEVGVPASSRQRGRFSEFSPFDRLVVRHMIEFVAGVAPYESTMQVEFFPRGEWVRMVVTLDPMHSDHFSKMAANGLTSQLANMDRQFQGRQR